MYLKESGSMCKIQNGQLIFNYTIIVNFTMKFPFHIIYELDIMDQKFLVQ
jgi:hypothetical protein